MAAGLILVSVLAVQLLGIGLLPWRWSSAGLRPYPNDEVSRYERRFAGLRQALPPRGAVGYVEDQAPGQRQPHKAYLLTQYALAPVIVLRSSTVDLVVANFHAPGDSAATDSGWVVRDSFPDGLALLQVR